MSALSKNDAVVNMAQTSNYSRKPNTITIDEKEIDSPYGSSGRPSMGRRQTTDGFGKKMEEEAKPPLARFFAELMENEIARYAIYILPVASILAIPLALYCTVLSDAAWTAVIPGTTTVNATNGLSIGSATIVNGTLLHGTYLNGVLTNATVASGAKIGDTVITLHKRGIMLWLELCWAFLWIAKILATIIPNLFWSVGGLITTGIRKYALVLKAVKTPMSIFLWALLCIASYNIIYVFDLKDHKGHGGANNPMPAMVTFHKVLKVSTGMAALWLAEKMLVQLISVNYHAKAHHDKIKDIKKTTTAVDRLYDASLQRFPDRHRDFIEEDIDIHDANNVQKILRKRSAAVKTRQFWSNLGFAADRVTTAFGRIASDITGQEVLKPTATHATVEQALERKLGSEALARRIFRSLCPAGADTISEEDLVNELGAAKEDEARWIFSQLDRDGNGDVSLDEMIMLICGIARQRRDMWRNAVDIKDAIKILDAVLSFIVLVVVILFYAAFFSTVLSSKASSIWTFFTGSAFALANTVGEFNSACIFVFIKHPYDIGDRVNINLIEYEVTKISLLYSVFKRIDNETLVSVSNQALASVWIENVSRSKAMKERLTFSVSSATTFDDIELLRVELEKFVQEPENSRHFMPEVDIQLLSVGDLKQLDLRVEILHKSNWAIEKLRAERRSRFMCALLSAMRKVPIDGPAGSAPAQGSINNPNYAVAISDDIAKTSKAQFDADKDAKRLFPHADGAQPNTSALSSALDVLKTLRKRESLNVDAMGIPRTSVSGPSVLPGGAGAYSFSGQWDQRPSTDGRQSNYPVARSGPGFV